MFASVSMGTMPPRGGAAEDIWLDRPTYSTSVGEPLAGLDTPAGREVLQNWLACGAPVIERTLPRVDGVPSVHSPSIVRAPIEPTWASVFEDLLQGRGCAAVRCHGGGDPNAGFEISEDASVTYRSLVDAQASGSDETDGGCGAMGGTLVVPTQPDASLLIQKLRAAGDDDVCGRSMPRNGHVREDDIQAIEQWIREGACEAPLTPEGVCAPP